MKIAVVHRNGFELIGGVEGTIYNIANTLHELCHEVVVISSLNDKAVQETEVTEFCKIRKFARHKSNKLTSIISPYLIYKNSFKKLKQIILEEAPDVIICRDNILTLAISKFFDNDKLIYVPLGVIKFYNRGIRKFSGFKGFVLEFIRFFQLKLETVYQNKTLKKLNNIIVFSDNMRKQVLQVVGKSKNVKVVHPGVIDNPLYTCAYDYSVHDELGISHEQKIFLYVGRVVQEKNVRMLIEAFAKLGNDNVNLCIVGDGPDANYTKELAHRLNISHKVFFVGFRRDTERFYKAADYLILPSYYESFGNVIPEALISGTPVVGFKTEKNKTLTAIDELIKNDIIGIICKDYSMQSLADAMATAYDLCNDNKFSDIRKECRTHAIKTFNWERFVNECISLAY